MKSILLILITVSAAFSMIISPEKAMKLTFKADTITKKSMILTKAQHAEVQKLAKTRLKSKLYRIYIAQKGTETVGIGILLTHIVRSNTTAVLYIMTPQGELQNIEIIAFREPKEYLPSKRWIKQFTEHKSEHYDYQNGTIDNISGATLSANAIINVANLAQAIYKVALKK